MKPKAPASIRAILAEAVDLLQRGSHRPLRTGQSDERVAGWEDARAAHHRWRQSWPLPKLRAVLAYLDGEHSETEIRVYHQGMEYERSTPHNQGE